MVEKLQVQLYYAVIRLSFEDLQKLLGVGGGIEEGGAVGGMGVGAVAHHLRYSHFTAIFT